MVCGSKYASNMLKYMVKFHNFFFSTIYILGGAGGTPIKFSKMSALVWYLVFLSNMIPASRAALVAAMLVTFLLTRACQTIYKAF